MMVVLTDFFSQLNCEFFGGAQWLIRRFFVFFLTILFSYELKLMRLAGKCFSNIDTNAAQVLLVKIFGK